METESELTCDVPMHLSYQQGPKRAVAQRRILQQQLNDPVLLAFGPVPADPPSAPKDAVNGRFSALEGYNASLPHNVQLLTTKVLDDGQLLLRLAHLFQVALAACRTGLLQLRTHKRFDFLSCRLLVTSSSKSWVL